ncbi:unnamed protein product [Rotaria magnacalcarata]|uniref:Uncharacterized protein n=1 Tax=Rotaria magnacalcarata TaxID=392030 RepID=A0A814TZL3_9BILA|nr:unnamed protein product [Rotaria magnacalcarata]
MKEKRNDDGFRLSDNRRRAESLQIARQNDEFKNEENKRRAEAHKIERRNDEFKKEENKRRAEAHKIERQNIEFRTQENDRRLNLLKIKREEEEYKEEERRRNASRMRLSRDKYENNFHLLKLNYESKIKEGPTHICSCCGGLWFEYSIEEFTVEMLRNKGLPKEFIDKVYYLKNTIIKLCVTCRKDIMLNKVPNLCLSNVLENKVITLEEAENLSYEKKCDLIRKDPVTCVRYFEHRLKCLWEILLAPCGPFEGNGLEDKYIRVEFQFRGSPHIHVCIRLKNAPKYDKNNPKSIEQCTVY